MPNIAEVHNDLRGKHTFPDTKTIAEFRYLSQAIVLSTIIRSEFETKEQPGDFVGTKEVAGTIFHEVTHWADMTGTTWGRRYLREIYDALPLLDQLQKEETADEFWRMVAIHDRGRRLMYPKYYRVQEGKADEFTKETRIDFSGGVEFDTLGRMDPERPILFVRFHGQNDEVFVRQPLTVGALLETIAVWSEVCTWLEVSDALPEVERTVERGLIMSDLEKLASDPQLTLYTAPARMFEHFTGVTDALTAYEAAAKIAHLCLNLDERQFSDLVLPERMSVWGERNLASRRNMDPAFAYVAILLNAGELGKGQSVSDWLALGLEKSGLLGSSTILSLALERMKNETEVAESRWSEVGRYLLSAGERVAAMRLRTLDPAITPSLCREHALPLPPLIDADLVAGRLPSSSFDYSKYDPIVMYDVEWEMDKAMTNFLSACR